MIYLFYKVRQEDIFRIKFILEAYENMMSVSTIDEKIPKIQVAVAPDFIEDANAILEDLQKSLFMERIFEDPEKSQGRY